MGDVMGGCRHGGSTDCRQCHLEAYFMACKYSPANVDRLIEDNSALQIESIQLKQDITELTAEVERLKEAQRWIHIGDLPFHEHGRILVLYNLGYVGIKMAETARRDVDITHWLPLPAPPQEQSE